MADCLVYWKYFRDEAYEDEANAFTQHWFTRSPYFFDQIKPGNNLWVVVSGGREFPQEWRLLQRILVRALKPERTDRPYHAIGDTKKSQIFDIRKQKDLAPFLRKLKFASGVRITAKGKLIGRSLQSIRPLAEEDVELLENYTRGLKKAPDFTGLVS
jgi:hypothetical protein